MLKQDTGPPCRTAETDHTPGSSDSPPCSHPSQRILLREQRRCFGERRQSAQFPSTCFLPSLSQIREGTLESHPYVPDFFWQQDKGVPPVIKWASIERSTQKTLWHKKRGTWPEVIGWLPVAKKGQQKERLVSQGGKNHQKPPKRYLSGKKKKDCFGHLPCAESTKGRWRLFYLFPPRHAQPWRGHREQVWAEEGASKTRDPNLSPSSIVGLQDPLGERKILHKADLAIFYCTGLDM